MRLINQKDKDLQANNEYKRELASPRDEALMGYQILSIQTQVTLNRLSRLHLYIDMCVSVCVYVY